MANNITIKDASGSNVVTKTTDNTSVHTAHVNVDASALPSGAATAANQSTANGLLATMDADTGNIATSTAAATTALQIIDDWDETDRAKVNIIAGQAGITAGAGAVGASTPRVTLASDDPAVASLATLDNAISGNEMQVDVVAALPAGTNNIGDVDVLSVVPGTGATNLGKAIGNAGGATDTGVPPLAIRDDSLSALSDAEGDYVPLRVNSTGALHVTGGGGGTQYAADDALGSTPTGTVALAQRDDALSSLTPVEGDAVPLRTDANGALWVTATAGAAQKADDEAFTLASDSVIMIGGIRDDSLSTLTAVEGDAVPFRVSSTGALHVTGGGGGTEYTEDVATANPIVGTATMMERDDALSTLTPVEGDWAAMRCDANGALWVNPGTVTVASHAVTNAGTFAVQVDGSALTALQIIDNPVLVDDAAFTPATSSVMMAGFQADETAADSVDEGDAGAARMTLDRKVIVNPRGNATGGATPFRNIDVDESEDDIKTSPGTLYSLFLYNSTDAPLYVKLYNATAASTTVGTTTPLLTIPVPGNGDSDGAGVVLQYPMGLAFSTALCIAATTGVADNDTGAPGANAIVAHGTYV